MATNIHKQKRGSLV